MKSDLQGIATVLKLSLCMQVQGSDTGSISEEGGAPNNVVAIEVSKMRTVLSILGAGTLNSGPYRCMAVSEDGEEAMADVDISVQ